MFVFVCVVLYLVFGTPCNCLGCRQCRYPFEERAQVGIHALASILAILLDTGVVLLYFWLELMLVPFWRSGETRVQCCRGLLVGVDALVCILAIGLDKSAVLSLTFGWN